MALDYQLDRKVRFVNESEYKSLYKWSLQEFDETGKKIGLPQVPWSWSLPFTATEVLLSETLELDRKAPPLKTLEPVLEDPNDWKVQAKERVQIQAKLRPGYFGSEDDTSYSMFGTSRVVKDFGLAIHSLENEADDERAQAWGSVQYSYEGGDFRTEVSEDTLQFYLDVKPSRFAQYVEMIRKHPATLLSLRLQSVMGAYSEWSPSIRTDQVKVLASAEDQKVEISAGSAIKPRELGWIGTFEITFTTIRESIKQPQPPVEREEIEAIASGVTTIDDSSLTSQALLQLAVQGRDRLKQLVFVAWAIVALLVVLLLRH